MRYSLKVPFLAFCLLILASLACSGSFSTANISDAYLSKDDAGDQPTIVFAPTDTTVYLQVQLSNAPDDTTVKAVWTAVSVTGEEPNLLIDETTLTGGDGGYVFNLQNDNLWPAGQYKVDLYLNDELDRTLNFTIEE
ncbi:MAG: hypothetical protein WAM60_03565 [Candidatus Promineifilaceae bacterium]